MRLSKLAPLLGIPGSAWCLSENIHVRELLEKFDFTLDGSWSSNNVTTIANVGHLGLYVSSGESRHDLFLASEILRILLAKGLLPPLAKIILVGRSNTPLGIVRKDGAYDQSFIGSLEKYGLSSRYISREEIKAAWIRPRGGREEFRLERHLWVGEAIPLRPVHSMRPLSLSEFIDIPMGVRGMRKRLLSKLKRSQEILQLSDEITTHCWSNAQVTTVQDMVARKEFLVRTIPAWNMRSPLGLHV